ncbi:MAG: hypothetical protein U1E76_26940 [Planctomycetota bacterium]
MTQSREPDCLRFACELPELLYGSLEATLAAEVRAHVSRCGRCERELRAFSSVLRTLDRLAAIEPDAASRPALLHRLRAARRRRRSSLHHAQALLLSVAAGAAIAVLARMSSPLRSWLTLPWLDSVVAKQPWLAGCLAPIAFWLAASLLVVMTSPLLFAARKRAMQSLASPLLESSRA